MSGFEDDSWGNDGFDTSSQEQGFGFDTPEDNSTEDQNNFHLDIDEATHDVGELPVSTQEVKEEQNTKDSNSLEKALENKPENNSDFKQLIELHQDFSVSTYTLIELVSTAIKELEKTSARTNSMNTETQEVAEEYQKSRNDLAKSIAEVKTVFELSKSIIQDLSKTKTALEAQVGSTKEDIENSLATYRLRLNKAQEQITSALEKIPNNINLNGLEKTLEEKIDTLIKQNNLGDLPNLLKTINEANRHLNNQSIALLGDENTGKIGILSKFISTAQTVTASTNQIKKGIYAHFFVYGAAAGIMIGIAGTIIFNTINYEDRFAEEMNRKIIDINKEYNKKISNLEEELAAFNEIKRKYSLTGKEGKYGFGYYEDTHMPFFYFPSNTEIYISGDKKIVDIPVK